jgi:outer membrane immunogenic protein
VKPFRFAENRTFHRYSAAPHRITLLRDCNTNMLCEVNETSCPRPAFPSSQAALTPRDLKGYEMKKVLFASAAMAGLLIGTPAMAQDANDNFTGLKVEGLVGYDSSRPGSTVDDDVDGFDESIDDVNYGVGVGYDFNAGGVILGVEGEFMESEASTEYDTSTFGAQSFGVSNIEAGRDLYVGARVGTAISDSAMIYAKGGYTNARYNVLATDNSTEIGTDLDLDGWRAGAGVELALSNNLFAKAEYRYSNYTSGQVEAPSGLESDRF